MAENPIAIQFMSKGENVSFSRSLVALLASQIEGFTLEEIEDIKTAVSEAVSNCVIHAYPDGLGTIWMETDITAGSFEISIRDQGVGIEDVGMASQPAYSSCPEERMGLGIAFMNYCMDEVEIQSAVGQGTTVRMVKRPQRQEG